MDELQWLLDNPIKKQVILHNIKSDNFDADMTRRVAWGIQKEFPNPIQEKYNSCLQRMHLEWDPILEERQLAIPVDSDAFAQLVFAQPDYKDRDTKDLELVI